MKTLVWRVQDGAGRGPYKPGKSIRWCDDTGTPPPPTLDVEFPSLYSELQKKIDRDGGAFGCATRTPAGLAAWFTATERPRLGRLGYKVVCLQVDEIMAESENQVVFWRRRPLNRDITVVSWCRI